VGNTDTNTVSVLLNTTATGATTASFAPQQTFAVGISPRSVVVGDFNGDGKPDLAVANSGSNTVSVLLNTIATGATTASFAAQQAFSVGSDPFSVAAGDFNGDGKPDLAVANNDPNTHTASVLLNDNLTTITLSGSPATGTISSALEAPATIVDAGGHGQSATVATPFAAAMAADVRDASGHTVQGVSVTFTAPFGGGASGTFGSGNSVTVVTNASGRATAPTFVANTIAGGPYSVTVQAAGGSNPSTTIAGLQNLAGAPAFFTATAGFNQSARVTTAFATSLLATLTDQYGNPVRGATVTFADPGSGASATFTGGNTGTTNASGQVSKGITANFVAGTYAVTAKAAGGSNPTAIFVNLTNTPNVPAGLNAAIGSNQSTTVNTAFPTSLWAFVYDQYGNTVPGVVVTFTAPSSGASAVFTGGNTATTNANGLAVKAITANSVAGTYNITATAGGGSQPGDLFVNLTNAPGTADHFQVTTTAGNPDFAGTPFDVTVTAQDAFGNTATGYRGTVHFSSADPFGATLPGDYAFKAGDAGVHTFPGGATLFTAGTWDVTATDTQSGITGTASVTVQAAPAVALQVVAPSTATSGTPFDVTVIAVDPYGNTDTNYQGTITFSTSDGDPGVVLPPDYSFQPSDAGMVTFPGGVTLITLGDQTLTATDTVSGITGSSTVTVTAGGNAPGADRFGVKLAAALRESPVAPAAGRPLDANHRAGTAERAAASTEGESSPFLAKPIGGPEPRATLIDHVWSDPADLLPTDVWMDGLVWNEGW
jgi:hypothetical protein